MFFGWIYLFFGDRVVIGVFDLVVFFGGVFVLEGGYCFYCVSPFTTFPMMVTFLS